METELPAVQQSCRWTNKLCVLGETNVGIREELGGMLRKQYETATKSLRNTGQQMTSSQQIIQVNLST